MKQIRIEHLFKSYGNNIVLDDISYDVIENTVTFIAGPNGEGKTTFLNILSGLLLPDSGTISFSIPQKDVFVILSGDKNLYAKNTVKENIIYVSTLKGMKKIDIQKNIKKNAHYFPIYDSIKNKLVEELSFGQKRLITIFIGLVTNASCLILDEPSEGLDLAHKQQLINLIRSLKNQVTFIISSHDPDLISATADKILFLKKSSIITAQNNMSADEFKKQYYLLYQSEGEDLI